eukprot:TRINITY_DN9090_c0_g1_i1.p1 TRINITY_DN9090_c0_g1~~TRINITY_DN9090_c0_g1_i1.p1  ORF type:complete len:891 (+),score=311.97 TRINITY_DN9090_c0_g1_i1:208-2880(+)
MRDTEDWCAEYEGFVKAGGKWSATHQSERRVKRGVAFFRDQGSSDLVNKILFLKSKELTAEEIEKVLEECFSNDEPQLYLDYLTGKYESNAQFETTSDTSKDAKHLTHQQSSGAYDLAPTLWKVGQMVYAYTGDFSYHLVPLLEVNAERDGDMYRVAFMQDDGTWGESIWLADGLKGIVADIFPGDELLKAGSAVIAHSGLHRDQYLEATVQQNESVDGEPGTYKVQFTKTSETACLTEQQVRLVTHPNVARAMLEQQAGNDVPANKVYQSRMDFNTALGGKQVHSLVAPRVKKEDVDAANNFKKLPPEQRRDLVGRLINEDERYAFTAALRNYARCPPLNIEDYPTGLRTFKDYVHEQGELIYRTKEYVAPAFPDCQANQTGAGFGFNLTKHQHRPGCPALFRANPIIDVAAQCFIENTMFVDPYFPPSRHSLYGADIPPPTDDQYEWRRLSELCPEICIKSPTASGELIPGAFSPPWLPHLVGVAHETSDFEDTFSPMQTSEMSYGCFVVRVFVDADWHFLVLDDFVPVSKATGQVVSLRSENRTEVYSVLYEKALAKVWGSYAGMKNCKQTSQAAKAWELFTGGLGEMSHYALLSDRAGWVENLAYKNDATRQMCFLVSRSHARENKTLMRGVVSERDFERGKLPMGEHLYILTVKELEDPSGAMQCFVLLKNPYVDFSAPALQVPSWAQERLRDVQNLHDAKARSYWLTFQNYMKFHEQLLALWHFSNCQRCAISGTFAGRCGGSLFSHRDTFFDNNQYYIDVQHSALVAVQLSLVDRRFLPADRQKPDAQRLAVHVFKVKTTGEPLPPGSDDLQLFTSEMKNMVDDDADIEHPTVHFVSPLKPGGYIIIPDIGVTESVEDFSLKLWSSSGFTVTLLNGRDVATSA